MAGRSIAGFEVRQDKVISDVFIIDANPKNLKSGRHYHESTYFYFFFY